MYELLLTADFTDPPSNAKRFKKALALTKGMDYVQV